MAYPFQESAENVKQPTLVRLRIEGGYLDGFDFRFVKGGNAVIGEHAVGKTTLLSCLRHVSDLPVPPASQAAHEKLLEKNLGTGRVYVTFETPAEGVLTFSRALTRPKNKPDVPHDPPRFEPSMSRPGPAVPWSKDLFPAHFLAYVDETNPTLSRAKRDAIFSRLSKMRARALRHLAEVFGGTLDIEVEISAA